MALFYLIWCGSFGLIKTEKYILPLIVLVFVTDAIWFYNFYMMMVEQ